MLPQATEGLRVATSPQLGVSVMGISEQPAMTVPEAPPRTSRNPTLSEIELQLHQVMVAQALTMAALERLHARLDLWSLPIQWRRFRAYIVPKLATWWARIYHS